MSNIIGTTYRIEYDKTEKVFTLLEYFGEQYSNIIGKYTSLDILIKDLELDTSLIFD